MIIYAYIEYNWIFGQSWILTLNKKTNHWPKSSQGSIRVALCTQTAAKSAGGAVAFGSVDNASNKGRNV